MSNEEIRNYDTRLVQRRNLHISSAADRLKTNTSVVQIPNSLPVQDSPQQRDSMFKSVSENVLFLKNALADMGRNLEQQDTQHSEEMTTLQKHLSEITETLQKLRVNQDE